MTSGDLEEVLQQNLMLRHELAIEVAKAVDSYRNHTLRASVGKSLVASPLRRPWPYPGLSSAAPSYLANLKLLTA
jgi:hypothetical protein